MSLESTEFIGKPLKSPYTLQYCLAMASVSLVDIAMNSMYFLLSGRLSKMYIVVPESLVILGFINGLVAIKIFAPIELFIKTGQQEHAARRALSRLPLRSASWVACLTILYCLFLFWSGVFIPDSSALEAVPQRKIVLALIWFGLIYAIYYSFFTFFIVENTTMHQRVTLSRDHGLTIIPQRQLLRTKLIYTFIVVALIPISHLLMDLLLFQDIRLAQGFDVTRTVLLDLFSTLVVFSFAVFLVLRSIVHPVRALTKAVKDIDKGILEQSAVVVSDDEMGALVSAVNKMIDTLKERAFIKATFGQYLPESVAEDIIAGKAPIEPKIETATILFADIAGFTSIAEAISPAELVDVLNDYFSAVIKPIQDHRGVVNQFQGDGMLVTFNIPVRDPDHADKAMKAALQILNISDQEKFGGRHLVTRIGINTGLVFAGNVGSGDRFNYTVHGDAVNIASRLEALNKEMGTRILVSSATYDLLKDDYELSECKTLQIEGKDSPVEVYSIQD